MENTSIVIKDNIDLRGEVVRIGKGCSLEFQGGSFSNGTIVGNDTKMKTEKRNVFHNCIVLGSWVLSCSYSSMFDDDVDALSLLKSLSSLSSDIRLFANRDYQINANGEELSVASISAAEDEKPLIAFHTTDPNIDGLALYGKDITLKNLRFTDDYSINNDLKYGVNSITIGNMIAIKSRDKVVQSLKIEGCEFSGGTSSSFIASSQTRKCQVQSCYISGYMGDHAIYCSQMIESFIVEDCVIKDVPHTSGLFKIRSSKSARLFSISQTKAHNLHGYMAFVSLVDTPFCDLLFDRITVSKDPDNDYVFYGFCISDETKRMSGKGYNANSITLNKCNFECGYYGAPIIYPGSGEAVCVKTIVFKKVNATNSGFSGGNADDLLVKECVFRDCYGKAGIVLHARRVSIEDTRIISKIKGMSDCLFLVNYYNELLESLTLNNIEVDASVSSLFNLSKGENIKVKLTNSLVTPHINRLFYAPANSTVDIEEKNNRINKAPLYQLIGRKR